MLGTAFFIAFWVILGIGTFFVASRGGPRGAREAVQTQSPGGRRAFATIFTVVFLVCAIGAPIALLAGNHARASAQVGGTKLNNQDSHGRELFGTTCGACHTLAAAGAVGKVGPNLDQLKPPKALILDALVNGRLRGNGTMPAGLLPRASDREAVADFVAKAAGK